jgi:hypothetical protein
MPRKSRKYKKSGRKKTAAEQQVQENKNIDRLSLLQAIEIYLPERMKNQVLANYGADINFGKKALYIYNQETPNPDLEIYKSFVKYLNTQSNYINTYSNFSVVTDVKSKIKFHKLSNAQFNLGMLVNNLYACLTMGVNPDGTDRGTILEILGNAPGPQMPAEEADVYQESRGLDGNMWECVQDENGKKRWQLYDNPELKPDKIYIGYEDDDHSMINRMFQPNDYIDLETTFILFYNPITASETEISLFQLLYSIDDNFNTIPKDEIDFLDYDIPVDNLRKWIEYFGPMELWDTSEVTDMSWLLYPQKYNSVNSDPMTPVLKIENMFNPDISRWNTSNVVKMVGMFSGAMFFNQDISTKEVTVDKNTYIAWDVSKVKNYGFTKIFAYSNFNRDISNWNITASKPYLTLEAEQNPFYGDVSILPQNKPAALS